jgi:hypothetical protein
MLASVTDPDQVVPLAPPKINTLEPENEDEDPDGIVFTGAGMWHCEVLSGSDPVTPLCPSTGPVPVEDTVVAPDELLNPGMWCAPTVLIQPSITLASRETFIEPCVIDAKDKLEAKDTQQKICEPFSNATTHSIPSTNVSRCEATWLAMLLLVGAICAYAGQCLTTLKNKLVLMVWNLLKYHIFYWSTLCWDTLSVFTVKPKNEKPTVPRHLMRKAQNRIRRYKPL